MLSEADAAGPHAEADVKDRIAEILNGAKELESAERRETILVVGKPATHYPAQ